VPFESILFPGAGLATAPPAAQVPSIFRDLNLDQIVDAVIAGRQEYDLKPFFLQPLNDIETVHYRHEVLRDLESADLVGHIQSFAAGMRAMREHQAAADKLYYKQQSQAWRLDALGIYCKTVADLADALDGSRLGSDGFVRFRDHLDLYVRSEAFTRLRADTDAAKAALADIEYSFVIKDDSVRVCLYEGAPDYSADVTATFARFAGHPTASYLVKLSDHPEMNHIEAAILSRVERLHPEPFARLGAYCDRYRTYLDEKIVGFDREIEFYLSYLDYVAPARGEGLQLCYPRLSTTSKAIRADATFDLALAMQLTKAGDPVVTNDLHLEGEERIFVVSGPNQGGKTTFARTFGQLHYLASLGLPVPGREAHLLLPDHIVTHFERAELVHDLRGKLENDLYRIHEDLKGATGRTIFILNEIFTSTTLHDAILLSTRILERIIELDALCVSVTFIDELATLAPQTVSMVSSVIPDDPSRRTFKVERRAADGMAYAATIARRHRLTYDCLRERLGS
jgi:hypothetical protein